MVGGSVDHKHRLVRFCQQSCSLRVLTWVVALSSAAWSSYVYCDRSFRCPEGTVCIEGDRFGKGPPVTPYAEFTEVTNSHAVYRVSALLKTEQSPYQLVQAYQSHFFGKILVIDGALMITERDESNYHESLVHTTLNYLPDAKRVLVIGGGDGGTVTQLLKHPNLQEIVWVEIDEVVLRFAREFFPHLAKAQSDPRVTLRVQNAARFVQEAQYPVVGVNNGTFDAILLDTTDFGSAEPLFSSSFYADCRALLAPRGVLAFNLDSPQWGQVRLAAASEQLSRLFEHTYVFQCYQPTYSSGHYAFMFASRTLHPFKDKVDWAGYAAKKIETRYYNPDLHYASFLLPSQVQSVLHRVPRLHQLAPDIFPAYTLPGISTPGSSRSRVESLVSASSIPGPGDGAVPAMVRGDV